VQIVIDLDDGSGLKITTARYYTPSGRSIQENGIAPDVHLSQADEGVVRERDLAGHISNDAPPDAVPTVEAADVVPVVAGLPTEDDPGLRAAVAALREWEPFQAALAAKRAALH
jgi:carboxyl-terminal processing protease